MKIKFKNGSTIEVVDDKNETRRGKRGRSSNIYISPCKELLDTYGIQLTWYQRWHLRLLDKRLKRYLGEIDEYDG